MPYESAALLNLPLHGGQSESAVPAIPMQRLIGEGEIM